VEITVEITKDSIATHEMALKRGRNPDGSPTGRSAEVFKAKYIIESTQLHLVEAVAAIVNIQDAGDTSCHRARTIEPQNSITLLPMPTPRPPRLTAREII
jgi:hypothetical protein